MTSIPDCPPNHRMPGRKLLVIALLVLGLVLSPLEIRSARAEDAGSVLVRTIQASRGEVPDIRTAFGSVAPSPGGTTTLSLPQDGRVVALLAAPGETVRPGEALARFQPSAAAANAYAQAETALALARAQRDHAAQLLRQQLATRDQVAQADKAVADAKSFLDSLRREGGPAIASIVAPFAGVVASVPVAQGDRTQPGAPLMVLTRSDGLMATVGVEPSERGQVRPGQEAVLTPLDGDPPFRGRVLRIDAVLNPRTRLVDADISLPAALPPATAALSGEALRADIETGALKGWLVPHDAVLGSGGEARLFQVENGKAHRVAVRVLGGRGDFDVVEGPLNPKLRVVVDGVGQLEDGMAVREGSSVPSAAPIAPGVAP